MLWLLRIFIVVSDFCTMNSSGELGVDSDSESVDVHDGRNGDDNDLSGPECQEIAGHVIFRVVPAL